MNNRQPDFASFKSACRCVGVEITPAHFATLKRYVDLVTEWNTRVNLVSRRDTGRLLSYHTIDSLAVSPLIPDASRCSDIGTGAGLPGIPLAIVRPDIRMVLVESTKKKCLFLRECISLLALKSTTVINERAEALPSLKCDVVLSRLTGPFRRVIRQIAHHAVTGGLIVMFKNPTSRDSMNSPPLNRLQLEFHRMVDLVLPLSAVPRRLLVLRRR